MINHRSVGEHVYQEDPFDLNMDARKCLYQPFENLRLISLANAVD